MTEYTGEQNDQANTGRTNSCRSVGKVLQSRRVAVTLFVCVACAWLMFDIATKAYVNSGQFSVGQHIAGPFCGLFEFVLVYNTGAAWGIFNNATFALGVFSVAMCVAIALFFFVLSKHISVLETLGLALVFAGGVGNAIDRFAQGYVVDFIHVVFIDFPVFNIADIGVTCGMVLFFVFFIARDIGGNAHSKTGNACGGAGIDGENDIHESGARESDVYGSTTHESDERHG